MQNSSSDEIFNVDQQLLETLMLLLNESGQLNLDNSSIEKTSSDNNGEHNVRKIPTEELEQVETGKYNQMALVVRACFSFE